MIINPNIAIQQQWIVGDISATQVQPNAIDFPIDRWSELIAQPIDTVCWELIGGNKSMIPRREVTSDFVLIQPNTILDVTSDLYVSLPRGVVCRLIIRSTLARNGLILTHGLYDQGYQGHIGCMLHNYTQFSGRMKKGTMIAQIIFEQSEDSGLVYTGQYNHSKGTTWETK